MIEMKIDNIKVTQVSYAEFTDYEFQPPATFYVMDSLQNYSFYHTSSRQAAQEIADIMYGKGKYTVKAAKIQKTKSKLESGGLSCYGTQSRRGQKK